MVTRPSFRGLRQALAPLVLFVLGACGNDATQPPDYGYPPDANQFNTGDGGNGGGYDSSTTLPFVCPPDLQRCAHDFSFPYGNETSVELRGDWGGPATWVTGAPMTHSGGTWQVSVDVPYNKPVQYKYLVNGTTWTLDPTAPTTTDGNGNTNSLLAAVTCNPTLCDAPPS